MRTLVLVAFILVTESVLAQGVFIPPRESSSVLSGVSLDGQSVGEKFRKRFVECDTHDTLDGKPLKYGCSRDRNRNSVLLKLKGGVIFFDAKLGLDADGSPYSKKTPGKTDQPQTSMRYPFPGRPSINSDRVPFIVIPKGGFAEELGVKVGDVGAVIYGSKKVFAVVADQGPVPKIGEGSIDLHEKLGHPVCLTRSPNGDCTKLKNSGLERNVLYFIFPGTSSELTPGLTPENINLRIEDLGAKAWAKLISR